MTFILLSALVAAALAQSSALSDDDLKTWEKYKVDFSKTYKSEEEEIKRRNIFLDSLKKLQDHNAILNKTGELSTVYNQSNSVIGYNQLANLTGEVTNATADAVDSPQGDAKDEDGEAMQSDEQEENAEATQSDEQNEDVEATQSDEQYEYVEDSQSGKKDVVTEVAVKL